MDLAQCSGPNSFEAELPLSNVQVPFPDVKFSYFRKKLLFFCFSFTISHPFEVQICLQLWARPEFAATWRRPVGPLCSSLQNGERTRKIQKYTFHTEREKWEKERILFGIGNEFNSKLSKDSFDVVASAM